MAELDTWVDNVPIVRADPLKILMPEHEVELREAEDERFALVNEGDADIVGESRGQPRR